jgi:RNA polymerase sigma-70 factor (sigma-E family)
MSAWREQFDEMSTTRYPALLSYATLLTGDRPFAEDLVQDALLRTFSRPRRFPTPGHAEAYVRRAIHSVFIDSHRRRSTLLRTFSRVVERDAQPDASPAVDDRDLVSSALSALAPRVRACIVLRFYDDLAIADIGERLGLSVGATKRYLSDGVTRLRELLDEPDLTIGDDQADVSVHAPSQKKASLRRAP